MITRKIMVDAMEYNFQIDGTAWQVDFSKSQTRVKDVRQLALLKENSTFFVAADFEDKGDALSFTFDTAGKTTWDDLRGLERNDKLRAIGNVARFSELLKMRFTFFLHPENMVFDVNQMPFLVYRGIRDVLPPYTMTEEKFLKQYKCLIVALFSKKYSFDELISGSLDNAKGTSFERSIIEAKDLATIEEILAESYTKETAAVNRKMTLVQRKNYRLFKGLTIGFIIATLVLAVPVAYFAFVKVPFQETLLSANEAFIADDYGKVTETLRDVDPTKLPQASKFELAKSYVESAKLSDVQKKTVLQKTTLKSPEEYLLYWIYDGQGELTKANDIALTRKENDLQIYNLARQIEQLDADTDMKASTRNEKQEALNDKIKKIKENEAKTKEDIAKEEANQKEQDKAQATSEVE
ncbi:type VII secretion protein EssB [Paenilisteria newyorkensis]|uniref:type VII secretion protein EssB n=1 Tax=Listeria newyorkensis TaxID=1497681 RepID=UPI000568C3CB|nr:type VII secretion protein EssB [Listeria newyorkensis]WAO20558.1 type VII secretion protein EssB [Listeria newyorkensis]SQC56751.1 type VII secretion protein EssB [Listeria newyorkensis]